MILLFAAQFSRISYPKLADKINIQKENSLRSVHLSREPDKLDLISLIHNYVQGS